MKRLFAFLPALMVAMLTTTAFAQFDDLYYDPDKDAGYFSTKVIQEADNNSSDPGYTGGNYGNDDDYYYDGDDYDENYGYNDDDYDYYYSSRIRRFHRPYTGFGFFDPCYVDVYNYDPFFTPGVTILIYDDYSYWRRWNRFQRWNYWNDWNSWNPWNRWNSWNSWGYGWGGNNTYIQINNYYGNSWGWNNYGWGGYGGYNGWGPNYYYPPTWGNGYDYNTTTNIDDNVFYGPRKSGSVRTERPSVRIDQKEETGGRVIAPTQKPQVIEKERVSPTPATKPVTPTPPRERTEQVVPRGNQPVVPPREQPTPRTQPQSPRPQNDRDNNYRPSEPPRTQPQRQERPSAPPPSYNRPKNDDNSNRSYEPPRSNPQPRNYEAPKSNNNQPSQNNSAPPRSNNNSSDNNKSNSNSGRRG